MGCINKKGAMLPYELVWLILIISGFLLVLVILYMLNVTSGAEEKICALSVLARASVPGEAQGTIPLKCSTKKICFTGDKKNNCKESFAGEKPEVIVIDKDSKEEIEKKIVEKFYGCWEMMGEGKVSIFGRAGTSLGWNLEKPTCVICSRIAFDKSSKEKLKGVDIDIEGYMKNNAAPGKDVSYYDIIRDEQINSYAKIMNKDGVKNARVDNMEEKVDGDKYPEMAIVFSQIKTEEYGEVFAKIAQYGVIFGAAAFYYSPGKTVAVAKILTLNRWGVLITSLTGIYSAARVGVNIWRGQENAALYCGDFVSQGKAKKSGCSLIQIVPYSVENINLICPEGQIEGEYNV